MPRRIICERYLENAAESLDDYKFFCFDGEPRLIQMDTGRFSRHVQQYYTTDWQRVDMQVIANPEGFGFLRPDEGGDDLFLPPYEMRKVMHGDRALANVTGIDRRGRREGSIARVLDLVGVEHHLFCHENPFV